jgi:polysaccharide export outer membrane protein
MGDYVLEPPDVILVEVLEALPGRPISGERLVRPDGKISLGFYGDVYVAGLTLPEAKEKIIGRLQKFLTDESLGLFAIDPTTDKPKLDPSTNKEIMIDPKDSATVFVDITAYNSKNYYVEGSVFDPSRLPVTGRETVLDAIHFAGGLTPNADHNAVVLYRQEGKDGLIKSYHIDIDKIMMGDDLATNYQLRPGDRLVVPHDPSVRAPAIDSERRQTVTEHRAGPSRYFARGTEDLEIDKVAAGRRRDQTSGGSGQLTRMEARLTTLEQKLDQVLEALKTRTP